MFSWDYSQVIIGHQKGKLSFGLTHTCKLTVRSRVTSFTALGLSFLTFKNEEIIQLHQEDSFFFQHPMKYSESLLPVPSRETECHWRDWRELFFRKVFQILEEVWQVLWHVSALLLPSEMTVERKSISLFILKSYKCPWKAFYQHVYTFVDRINRSISDHRQSPGNA